jgi:hypothetical protein
MLGGHSIFKQQLNSSNLAGEEGGPGAFVIYHLRFFIWSFKGQMQVDPKIVPL